MSIYGNGISFPFKFENGRIKTASGEDLVWMSVDQIINTDISERPFLLKDGVPYGTRVRRALFSPAGAFIDIFRYDVPRALQVWEPRIVLMDVTAMQSETEPSKIITSVVFRYRSTNREDNYVKPYRLKQPDSQR